MKRKITISVKGRWIYKQDRWNINIIVSKINRNQKKIFDNKENVA